MGRKSFTGAVNPAMQFITDQSAAQASKEAGVAQRAERPAHDPGPETFTPRRLPVETKTRRVNLMLQPSLYERVQEAAAAQRMSVNEYVSYTLWESMRKGE